MEYFVFSDLETIARRVLDNTRLRSNPEDDSSAIPGWDSLQHTLIILEINDLMGLDIDACEASAAKNFGELVAMINDKLAHKRFDAM